MEHKCKFCNYETNKKYNLLRHHNAKHKCQIIENTSKNVTGENVHPIGENVHPKCENVHPKCENVHPICENVHLNQFICKKCNKIYNSNRYLKEHEKKCKGIDDLTCPRCMISFSSRQSKSNHMKKDNCKPD
tara:strand:+ start:291 stop:686 length:396 start_codon:yes stop_codon:yes gene_type:complete